LESLDIQVVARLEMTVSIAAFLPLAPHEPSRRPPRLTDENPGEGVMNNFSLLTADRMTHLKIVVVSLVCATLVAGVGVAARVSDSAAGGREATVLKIGKPMTASTGAASTVR
jgi:hypothetical protein